MSTCFTFANEPRVLKCFNGDMRLAQSAIDASNCIVVMCGSECF